ncbi:MAG TPA: peptidylprolyl isomerase [Gemmatimonadaceae bacterium]|jgi:cyclophilin family peptidyl-prolyl cis-trans isomerase
MARRETTLLVLAFAALGGAQPRAVGAQQPLSRADSALVFRILTAEDRRDASNAALREGASSADARIRLIARRAAARIGDPKFAARDSLPAVSPPPSYPDAPWRARFRAIATRPINCDSLRVALADSVWAVRLRAADLVVPACASDATIMSTLQRWANNPPSHGQRRTGDAGWRSSAHAVVALARIAPATARPLLRRYATSPVPGLRAYAARAAAPLADTATLRTLAADANDNVREVAVDSLARVSGHASDDIYLRALDSRGYQVIRAAARALKGSPRSKDVLAAARPVLARLRADSSETSHDARAALGDRLKEFGDSTSIDLLRAPPHVPVPSEAVGLALGREYRLRVTLADSSGGGSFIVHLRGDVAPIMAARMLTLARAGWYNGRTWYRVEPDFVIQGGGPGSNEYVGHPRFLRDELSALPQLRGTVGMSTRGHDTGDAQWFINLRDNQRLTRDYTTFAEVTEGMDVVDGILEGDVIARMELLPAKPHD